MHCERLTNRPNRHMHPTHRHRSTDPPIHNHRTQWNHHNKLGANSECIGPMWCICGMLAVVFKQKSWVYVKCVLLGVCCIYIESTYFPAESLSVQQMEKKVTKQKKKRKEIPYTKHVHIISGG